MKNIFNKQLFASIFNIRLYNSETIFIVLAYMLVISAMVYRSFYGIEITDESLYIAEGYIVTQGATPYVDMWLHASGFAFLNAPFIWIYTFITGSTSGIFLYFRSISLLIRVSIIILICLIMKPYMSTKLTAFWHLPLLAFVPHSIITMSYNTWAVMLLPLCCVSIVHSVLCKKNRTLFGAISGGVFAFIILCYPIMIILGIIILFLIFTYEHVYQLKHYTFFGFLSGGVFIGLAIVLLLLLHSGNFWGLISGLDIIINDNPYISSSKGINSTSLQLFAFYMINWIIKIIIPITFINLPFFSKRQKINIVIFFIIIYISFISFRVFINFLESVNINYKSIQITDILCRSFFPITALLFLLINKKKQLVNVLTIFIYLPALFFCLIANFLVFNGMNQRFYFLIYGTLLIIPFLTLIFDEIIENSNNKSFFSSVVMLVCFIFTFGFLLNYYNYIYREKSIEHLTHKINYGIFSGIYTTEIKGKGLIFLEKTIKDNTNKFENILFMDCVPMAYLMTKAQHCSPTTWDMLSFTYGFTDDTLLQKYFKIAGRTPDKIIYIFTGRDKVLSIDSKDYKFNDYVNRNYKLTSNINAYYPVKIYEKYND